MEEDHTEAKQSGADGANKADQRGRSLPADSLTRAKRLQVVADDLRSQAGDWSQARDLRSQARNLRSQAGLAFACSIETSKIRLPRKSGSRFPILHEGLEL